MATQVILPMLGETMNEGLIVEWLKEEGQAVRRGEVLFRVESDKATLEVEASEPGFLRAILAPAGSTVPVLSAVAVLTATADEAFSLGPASPSPLPTAAPSPAASSASPTAQPGPDSGRTVASPRARRVARERGVNLTTVRGSGPGGRITERDVPASQSRARRRACFPRGRTGGRRTRRRFAARRRDGSRWTDHAPGRRARRRPPDGPRGAPGQPQPPLDGRAHERLLLDRAALLPAHRSGCPAARHPAPGPAAAVGVPVRRPTDVH